MPSWGAPAGAANTNSHTSKPTLSQSETNSFSPISVGQSPGRYQRPSPYPVSSNVHSREGVDSMPRGLMQTPTRPPCQSGENTPSFSSDNPFQSQPRFSSDNPFQSSGNSSVFSPDNPYSHRDMSSPVHQPTPRPLFQSSPLVRTPGGRGHPRFSPRTPLSGNNSSLYSSSPRYQTPPNRFQSGNNRGFGSARRGFGQRNGSFSNPGGSEDIQKYIHPSMLEDPWQGLPATPLMQTY